MIIRKFRKKDAKEANKLIVKVFVEFNAPGLTRKGSAAFLKEQTPEKIIERAKSRNIFIATIGGKIIGLIEGNSKDRVTRLFVDKKYHNKEIATKLMNKIENKYKKKGCKKMKVRSSLYAVKFYESIGYKKSSSIVKNKDGMVYQPMKKNLK